MQENILFSGKLFTDGKNFTRPEDGGQISALLHILRNNLLQAAFLSQNNSQMHGCFVIMTQFHDFNPILSKFTIWRRTFSEMGETAETSMRFKPDRQLLYFAFCNFFQRCQN